MPISNVVSGRQMVDIIDTGRQAAYVKKSVVIWNRKTTKKGRANSHSIQIHEWKFYQRGRRGNMTHTDRNAILLQHIAQTGETLKLFSDIGFIPAGGCMKMRKRFL